MTDDHDFVCGRSRPCNNPPSERRSPFIASPQRHRRPDHRPKHFEAVRNRLRLPRTRRPQNPIIKGTHQWRVPQEQGRAAAQAVRDFVQWLISKFFTCRTTLQDRVRSFKRRLGWNTSAPPSRSTDIPLQVFSESRHQSPRNLRDTAL